MKILYWIFSSVFKNITSKTKTNLDDILLKHLQKPLTNLVVIGAYYLSVSYLYFDKNIEIENIKNIKLNPNEYLFHAGTTEYGRKIYAIGGRVLNFVSVSDDFNEAKKNVLKNISNLHWHGGFHRKDIGHKVTK